MMRLVAILLLVFAIPVPLAAQQATAPVQYAYTQLADPAQEDEARALMETLRCVTCQSQSIADSDAPMAGTMRHVVRSRIAAGQSPDEIRGFLMSRYGDYVSYEPQVSRTTWPLFAIPALLVLVALFVLARRLRRRA